MTARDAAQIVRALAAGGESYYVEFKSAWTYDGEGRAAGDIKALARYVGESVVGFGNADGGDLLVGVEDSGALTGIPPAWGETQVQFLFNAVRTQVLSEIDVGVQVSEVEVDGRQILLFRIPEYSFEELHTADGRCLRRDRARFVPVSAKQIRSRRSHRSGDVAWESEPVVAADLSDLDLDLLNWLRSNPSPGTPMPRRSDADPRLRRQSSPDLQMSLFTTPATNLGAFDSVLPMLRYWNLVEQRNGTAILRRAALLLFALEPLRWHPNARIRIRRSLGEEPGFGANLRTREFEARGPIATALPEAIRILSNELERESKTNTLFSTTQLLPSEAVEECVVNAVAHRNYAIDGQAIEVVLYPDRVEFRSPGRLPDPITLNDLRTQSRVHRSRNPIVMRVLRDLGWTRDQGEGIARIFGSMRQVELHEPELEEKADTFIVRLSTRSRYDPGLQAWIASYGPFGLRPDERRYLVELRATDGALSVDKLARRLGESYDETKARLTELERKHMVWHQRGTRTFNLVEPLNVPHEQFLRRIGPDRSTPEQRFDWADLATLAQTTDRTTLSALLEQWKIAGILIPAGKGQWRLGASFTSYLQQRGHRL